MSEKNNYTVYENILNVVAALSLLAAILIGLHGLQGVEEAEIPLVWGAVCAGLWSALLTRVTAVVLRMVTELRNAALTRPTTT